jgi:hypothetical protein
MDPLRFRTERDEGGGTRIFIEGPIDERADLAAECPPLEEETILNLAGVTRMNSIGLTRWVKWITQQSTQRRISVESVSYPCVMQANCVANFFGRAAIRSCMAPYFCTSCNASRLEVVTAEEVERTEGLPPEKECVECGAPLDFDELEHYFRILQHR